MSFFSKGTPYLTLFPRSGRLQFRIRIPSELQPCLGKREFRKSLGHRPPTDAKVQALRLAAVAHEVFMFTRNALQARRQQTHEALIFTLPSPNSVHSLTRNQIVGKENRLRVQMTQDTYDHDNQGQVRMNQGNNATVGNDTNGLQGRTLASLTDEEIRSIAEDWLLSALRGTNAFSLSVAHTRQARIQGNTEDVEFHAEADATTAGRIKRLYQTDLKARRMSRAGETADKQLASQGIECDPETENSAALPSKASLPYLKTCQELMKAHVSFYNAAEQSAQGEYAAYDAEIEHLEALHEKRRRRIKVVDTATTAPTTPPAAATPQLTVYTAVDEYITEQKKKGTWAAYSASKLPAMFHLFRTIVDPENSLPLAEVKQPHLKRYWHVMLGLPANRSKVKTYRDMLFTDLIKAALDGSIPEDKRVSPGTLRNHFQQMKAFFEWAGRNDYHSNPRVAAVLEEIKQSKQAHERRDAYTKDDIRLMFNPETYLTEGLKQQGRTQQANRFWIPLLALFTGARLEELAQLRTEDIVIIDSEAKANKPFITLSPKEAAAAIRDHGAEHCIICLNLHEGTPDQTIKNAASARFIPLSTLLIHDLNFLAYVREAASKAVKDNNNDGRLFPELGKSTEADRYGKAVSRWYGRYREAVQLPKGKALKDFHSFRGTVARWCLDNEIPLELAQRYIGHADESMTYGVYAGPSRPDKLYARITVGLTEYMRQSIDIEGLKASKWVRGRE